MRCTVCQEPITLVIAAATSTNPEIWIHTERQPWHGDYYDLRGHNAEASER